MGFESVRDVCGKTYIRIRRKSSRELRKRNGYMLKTVVKRSGERSPLTHLKYAAQFSRRM